uniref:Uncharacterized protein n=1 Tax=Ditylum brightwellii TaxID=49249 RepID=A0A6S8ZV05_9STRA
MKKEQNETTSASQERVTETLTTTYINENNGARSSMSSIELDDTDHTTSTSVIEEDNAKTRVKHFSFKEDDMLSNTSSDAMNLALDGRVYTTPVQFDHAEVIVVSPSNFSEGDTLRLDVGNNQIVVVQVVSFGRLCTLFELCVSC